MKNIHVAMLVCVVVAIICLIAFCCLMLSGIVTYPNDLTNSDGTRSDKAGSVKNEQAHTAQWVLLGLMASFICLLIALVFYVFVKYMIKPKATQAAATTPSDGSGFGKRMRRCTRW